QRIAGGLFPAPRGRDCAAFTDCGPVTRGRYKGKARRAARSVLMSSARLWSVLAWLALASLPASAADLTKIDRTIAKEPAYKNKPQYCLLVFGQRPSSASGSSSTATRYTWTTMATAT